MNDILNTLLLWSVPTLPLVLAFPALRLWLPWTWFRSLALLPAAIVVVLPATHSAELSWLLLNIGLGIETGSQLLLAMAVLLWIWVMLLLPASKNRVEDKYFTVFLLLTMAGNFGAILAIDLAGFFIFSTLLGYGFYGMLASINTHAHPPGTTEHESRISTTNIAGDVHINKHRGGQRQRAGHVYLVLLLVADIAFFEVLLITALTTDTLKFKEVQQTMVQSDYLMLYLVLVIFAFVVKAGIWPFHFWLVHAFRCLRPAMAILLCSVPVTIALLGMVRWLPLGEITLPELGFVVQGIGVVAVCYTILLVILNRLKKMPIQMLSVYSVMLATGLFTIAIGTGLTDAAAWNRFGNWLYYFIAALGLALAVLLTVTGWIHNYAAAVIARVDDPSRWFERWPAAAVSWLAHTGFHTLPYWCNWWLTKIQHLGLQVYSRQKQLGIYEGKLQNWSVAIILFLLLAIVITFVAASISLSPST